MTDDVVRPPSERTTVKRLAERGEYDATAIAAIVDEALICHVGFVHDRTPVVIPTIHARSGSTLYLHGSPASRMLRSLKSGEEVCVTVTLVDGIVVARAPFHSSMNYRSVVIFGEPRIVTDEAEKRHAFEVLTEHISRGRWDDARRPTDKEVKATLVAAVSLDEASAKVRSGPPEDDEEDYLLPFWAGVIPAKLVFADPVADPRLIDGVRVPEYLEGYRRPQRNTHLTMAELEAGLEHVRGAPPAAGTVDLIVRRPAMGSREELEVGQLDLGQGLVGDNWLSRGSTSTEDGGADPEMQLNIMSSRVAALVAQSPDRWSLAGDQFYVDLDLSQENLPPGTRLEIGEAIIEVTPVPHTGCAKFVRRFGLDAHRFVNSALGKELRLRGLNAKVLKPGSVRTGDAITRL